MFGTGYQIKIKANSTTKGFYIGEHSHFKAEKEMILQRGQKYKILKIEEKIIEVEIDE